MRRAAKVDGNQNPIVQGLRSVGASVAITSMVGNGFVDAVVGYRGCNYLVEIKDDSQPPSKRALTPQQQKFHASWRGRTHVVETLEEAFKAIGAIR